MLKFYLDKRIIFGCAIALATLSWLAYLSLKNKEAMVRSADMVAHTLAVLYNSERLLTNTTNIELVQRGFTITGEQKFIPIYTSSKRKAEEHLDKLTDLTSDNDVQQSRLLSLASQLKVLSALAEEAIQNRASSQNGQHVRRTLQGKSVLDSARSIIYTIQDEENRLLAIRTKENSKQVAKFNLTFLLLLLATTLILICIFYAINVNLRVRNETESKLTNALNEIRDLYDNAPCGYHSLDSRGQFVSINNTLCAWLGYAKDEVEGKLRFFDLLSDEETLRFKDSFSLFKASGAIYDLEFSLIRKDRTTIPVVLSAVAIHDPDGNYQRSRSVTINNTERKLAETKIHNLNKELEAFTYSVSHDLRAPLRSIDGYARILEEDYADKLDSEGKRVLNVIMNNAKRMGKLIDDLLDFARLGRKELSKTNADMTLLVKSVVSEVMESAPASKCEIIIEDLHSAPVDIDMMRQVWMNLVSNAVKYSGQEEKAQIHITSSIRSGSIEYEVRDNGVGFDMQYVSKLFGVFQRLHKIQDFSGTGVGLAIVKRIIDRHGGAVRAESQPNIGATFYFTIPLNDAKQ